MKKFATLAMLIAIGPLAHGASPMKPGLWEAQLTKQVIDGKDMTAQMAAAQAQMREQIAKMSPQQRQQMEKMMGGNKLPDQSGQWLCISAEMAAQDKPVMPSDAQCEPVKSERRGNKTTFEFSCTTAQGTSRGKGENVVDGDNVTTRMDMTITGARGTHTLETESKMKYLGADCQGLKPMDQVIKEMQALQQPLPQRR
jgi:hypothetical protein